MATSGAPVPEAELELYELPLDGMNAKPIPRCPGERGRVRLRATAVRVELEDGGAHTRVRFRSATCDLVAEWRIPLGRWSVPRCGERLCAVARLSGNHVEVWRLDDGVAEGSVLARFAYDGFESLGPPAMGISPDGDRLVVLGGEAASPHVIDARDGTATAIDGVQQAQSVTWSRDPDRFIVAGMRWGPNATYGVARIDLDGHRELVWTSNATWLGSIVGNPANDWIAGRAGLNDTRFVLLERE
jgi:hypothetical protein